MALLGPGPGLDRLGRPKYGPLRSGYRVSETMPSLAEMLRQGGHAAWGTAAGALEGVASLPAFLPDIAQWAARGLVGPHGAGIPRFASPGYQQGPGSDAPMFPLTGAIQHTIHRMAGVPEDAAGSFGESAGTLAGQFLSPAVLGAGKSALLGMGESGGVAGVTGVRRAKALQAAFDAAQVPYVPTEAEQLHKAMVPQLEAALRDFKVPQVFPDEMTPRQKEMSDAAAYAHRTLRIARGGELVGPQARTALARLEEAQVPTGLLR